MEEERLDYQDENGNWWVMCACGHRVGGTARPGDKIAVCVNCRFMGSIGAWNHIDIVYPDRTPTDGSLQQNGDHPDRVAERAEQAIRQAKSAKRKAQRLAREERTVSKVPDRC